MLQILLLIISCSLFSADFQNLDAALSRAMEEKVLPGGVIAVGKIGETLATRAFGTRDLKKMNDESTLYDLASLTKVVGTATSIMILEEEGKLSVVDKLSDYYEEFRTPEKKHITIQDLLRHSSGLPASIRAYAGESYSSFIHRALLSPLQYETGKDTVYSDVGFIILGDLVRVVSGMNLHEFTQKKIFVPLGMARTGYVVSESDEHLCAPTASDKICVPHDPKAYFLYPHHLGHAGLFSNIDDMKKFALMYLGKGEYNGVRILEEKTVEKMTVVHGHELRGLGWDLLSPYATPPRGEVFPKGKSYGHTGFTGTTMWIDPVSQSYYVFLSNRVLLGEDNTGKPFTQLRKTISTIVGEIIYSTSSMPEILQ